VTTSALPANHGLSTSKGRVTNPSTARCSRVLISIFTRIVTAGVDEVVKRNTSVNTSRPARVLGVPSHGASVSRISSATGPIGPRSRCTRSMSSEYRAGGAK